MSRTNRKASVHAYSIKSKPWTNKGLKGWIEYWARRKYGNGMHPHAKIKRMNNKMERRIGKQKNERITLNAD
jgi:hypothetical protein